MTYREQSGYPASFVPPVRRASCDTASRRATADHPPMRRSPAPPVRRSVPPDTECYDYDDEPRTRTSTRRYVQVHHPVPAPRTPPPPRPHWLTYAGLTLIIMLLGWLAVTLVGHWWTTTRDTMTYGNPRTAQYDEVVGHNDSPAHPSHFLALNLHGNVEVIEQAGGDPSHVHIYTIPMSFHDTDPVTLTFKDINGDGKLDMVVHVQSTDFPFINDSGQFRPVKAGEQINV